MIAYLVDAIADPRVSRLRRREMLEGSTGDGGFFLAKVSHV
jgi:hypothetical protein